MTAALISSCQRNSADRQSSDNRLDTEVRELSIRLEQLERRINEGMPGGIDSGERVPPGPIKSITFRSGTADDRLRIYWENGKVSSLPCTLEQGTWACG